MKIKRMDGKGKTQGLGFMLQHKAFLIWAVTGGAVV